MKHIRSCLRLSVLYNKLSLKKVLFFAIILLIYGMKYLLDFLELPTNLFGFWSFGFFGVLDFWSLLVQNFDFFPERGPRGPKNKKMSSACCEKYFLNMF